MSHKAVFFDRDGVINVDSGYAYRIEDFIFYEDFFHCITHWKKAGYKLIVVTNQSGIERGYYTIKDFLKLSAYMQDSMKKRVGFLFDRIYFCPLLHDMVRRKPASGMIMQAAKDFAINLSESYLVGDKLSDVEAAKNAGIAKRYLLTRETHAIQTTHTLPHIAEAKVPHNNKIEKNATATQKQDYSIIPNLYTFLPSH